MIGYPINFKINPRTWWEFRSQDYILIPSRSSDIWETWDHSKFKKYIQSNPLTKENAIYFLENHVSDISFDGFSSRMVMNSIKPIKFKITIERDISLEEKCISLMHELIHGFYRVKDSLSEFDENEEAIDTEAIRFYNAETIFMQDYVNHLLQMLCCTIKAF